MEYHTPKARAKETLRKNSKLRKVAYSTQYKGNKGLFINPNSLEVVADGDMNAAVGEPYTPLYVGTDLDTEFLAGKVYDGSELKDLYYIKVRQDLLTGSTGSTSHIIPSAITKVISVELSANRSFDDIVDGPGSQQVLEALIAGDVDYFTEINSRGNKFTVRISDVGGLPTDMRFEAKIWYTKD